TRSSSSATPTSRTPSSTGSSRLSSTSTSSTGRASRSQSEPGRPVRWMGPRQTVAMTKLKWSAVGVIAAALAVVGGTWVYINVIRAAPPPPLPLASEAEPAAADPTPSSTSPAGTEAVGSEPDSAGADDASVDGTWVPGADSVVGYRVAEILF